MENLIGQRLANRYDIQALVGYGGMGVVYRGYDALLRRTVAIKVLPPQLTIDPVFVQRFQQEAITAANLRHPHIVTIYDVGAQDGVYYIVMEYLEGMTLDQWLIQNGALTPPQTAAVVTQVADALDYAHAQGIVHRDIKPSNIMVDSRGHATLMDFGLVRAGEGTGLTRSSLVVGTPEYMAPEQALGQAVDGRTDVYALGAVLYKLLTGAAPFVRSTPLAIAHAHAYEPPPPLRELRPDLPKAVEAVVLKALAKKPADRYQSTGALAADFSAAASSKASTGRRAALAATPAKRTPSPPPMSPSPQPAPGPALAVDPAAATRLVERGQTPAGDPQPAAVAVTVGAAPVRETQAQRRASPTGLLLAAIAGLVVLMLVGAVWALSRPGDGAGEPEPALAATPAAPAVVMSTTDTPTRAPTAASSSTATSAGAEVAALPATDQTPTGTIPPTATLAPTATSPVAVAQPTSPVVTPTPTRRALFRGGTPTSTSMAAVGVEAPVLVSPPAGANLPVDRAVEFRWTGALPTGYTFEVRLWGQNETTHLGAAAPAAVDEGGGRWVQRIRVDSAPGYKGPGQYFWTVAILRPDGRMVGEANPRSIALEASSAATPTSTSAPPTSIPTPTRAATPAPQATTLPPTAAATGYGQAPIPVSPPEGASASADQSFSWRWNGPSLREDERFDWRLLRRRTGEEVVDVRQTSEPSLVYTLRNLPGGDYYWSVRVIRVGSDGGVASVLSPESSRLLIRWSAPSTSPPTDTPAPLPTDTPAPLRTDMPQPLP